MRRLKLLPLILGSGVILGVAFLLYSVVQQIVAGGDATQERPRSGRPVHVFRMDGINYTAQDGENIRLRLKADRIEVAKRKFGMVYLNPLKETVLENLDVEVHQREGEPPVVVSDDMVVQILPAETVEQFGVVTRIRIDGLTVKVIRDGRPVSTVTARQATIDPKTRITELTGGVEVATADGRSIQSQASTWDQSAGLFSISGPYLLRKPGGMVQGSQPLRAMAMPF
ncbi:MAG: LPS export ABC transporter periplasmic protein LptC [Nitrospirota bacterium]